MKVKGNDADISEINYLRRRSVLQFSLKNARPTYIHFYLLASAAWAAGFVFLDGAAGSLRLTGEAFGGLLAKVTAGGSGDLLY